MHYNSAIFWLPPYIYERYPYAAPQHNMVLIVAKAMVYRFTAPTSDMVKKAGTFITPEGASICNFAQKKKRSIRPDDRQTTEQDKSPHDESGFLIKFSVPLSLGRHAHKKKKGKKSTFT